MDNEGIVMRRAVSGMIISMIMVISGCAGSHQSSVKTAASEPTYPSVRLLSWSDFHSSMYEYATKEDGAVLGGLPVFMAAVEDAKSDGLNLLIDGGDMFQGAMPFNESKGLGMIEMMNALGIDVSTYGNHEFDYGGGKKYPNSARGALQEAVEASEFSWVNANVVSTSENTTDVWPYAGVKPYTIIEKGPYRIAVVGLLTVETPIATTAAHVSGLEFQSAAETLRRVIPEVVSQHPDMIIVNAHISGTPAVEFEPGAVLNDVSFSGEIGEILALPEEILSEVDLLLTGHSHLSFIAFEKGLPVIQSLSAGREITMMTLEGDKSGLHVVPESIKKYVLKHKPLDVGCGEQRSAPAPIDVGGKVLTPSQAGVDIMTKYENLMTENRCEVVTCLDEMMPRIQVGESAIGNLVSDALRAHYPGTDIAVQNAGGLRIDMPKGDIYRETLSSLMPFDNYLHLVELSGADVARLLKVSSTLKHGTTQVSGVQYKVEANCRNPEDINGDGTVEDWENNCLCDEVLVNGKPLDVTGQYKAAISDFMLNGGDDHAGCFNSAKLIEKGPVIKSIILDYVKRHEGCFRRTELQKAESPRITLGSCGGKYFK